LFRSSSTATTARQVMDAERVRLRGDGAIRMTGFPRKLVYHATCGDGVLSAPTASPGASTRLSSTPRTPRTTPRTAVKRGNVNPVSTQQNTNVLITAPIANR